MSYIHLDAGDPQTPREALLYITIARLSAQVEELQKDKELLDWAEQNIDDVSVSRDLSAGARFELTYCASQTGCQVGEKASSLRAVINTAMRKR